jgi:acyl dehydratase
MLLGNASIDSSGIEKLRSRVGVDLRVNQYNIVATRDNIKRFVRAIGDGNSLWLEPTYAISSPYGCIIAPPTFLYSVLYPSGALAGGLPGVHSWHGGNDWLFLRPLRVNDRITASAKLTDVVDKTSNYAGRSVIVYVEVSYKNQHGLLVASAKGWSIRTERETARQRGKYLRIPEYTYTPEEIRSIEEACLSEEVRGATIRYWDDVSVGEELPPVVKGPLTLEDMESFIAAACINPTYIFRVRQFRKHPAFFYRVPYTNAWEPVTGVNLYDYAAQAVGIPKAYDIGAQRICWLGHLLTNWMGDAGFLEGLNVKLLTPNLHGDTQWCKGKVTRKYTEHERFLVDCHIWCENQRGEQTANGTAVVRLLSRRIS